MFILADSVEDDTYKGLLHWVRGYPIEVRRTQAGSEAGSFKLLLDEAMASNLPSSEHVHFLEDDYIYLPKARDLIEEAIMFADYVTLRLHPDKFIPPSLGGNPLLDKNGGEETRVYQGIEAFWMLTNSTGMMWGTSMRVLKEDIAIWYRNVSGRASRDFDCWLELRDKGRKLVMPIPTGMSHDELFSASPLIGTGHCCWEFVLNKSCEHKKC